MSRSCCWSGNQSIFDFEGYSVISAKLGDEIVMQNVTIFVA